MSVPAIIANDVIDSLGITCVADLFLLKEIAWERGALLVDELLTGAEARILIARPQSIITISTSIPDPNRRRFGIGHELGHLELHRGKQDLFICSSRDLDSGGVRPKTPPSYENEANEFAACLLMPEMFFAPLCKDGEIDISVIQRLASQFHVSLTAAARRVAYYSPEPVAIVCSTAGKIRWFEASQEFTNLGLFVDVGERVRKETLAANAFINRPVYPKPAQVLISAWMRPGHYGEKNTLSEQSLAMTNYDSVLSLLWVNEMIDDDDGW